MNIESLSLDQLRVFVAVAEEGSFSAAARRFSRAQSAVSYSVSTLEQQLGVTLFDRGGYRPQLTPAGQTLLGDIAEIIARADRLKTQADAIARGLEPELALACDVLFPIDELGDILTEFQNAFPTVAVRAHIDVLGGVAELVSSGACAVGVLSTLVSVPASLCGYPIEGALRVPVAAADHPLAQMKGPIATAGVRDQVQIVLSDRSDLTRGRDFGVLSRRVWRVSDLGARHQLIRKGLGWGNLPYHMAAADIAAGKLKLLRLEAVRYPGEIVPLTAVHRADLVPGPAATWMIDRLRRADISRFHREFLATKV
jgi:DNA-binding transcriptional LysR family regulator